MCRYSPLWLGGEPIADTPLALASNSVRARGRPAAWSNCQARPKTCDHRQIDFICEGDLSQSIEEHVY